MPSAAFMRRSAKIFNLRRDHQKKFIWASRLWVGRRKEPILGYVSKNYAKNNSGSKGLIAIGSYFPIYRYTILFWSIIRILFPINRYRILIPNPSL